MEAYPDYAKFEYYVSFGRGDAGNTIEWAEKVIPEEAAIYVQAHRDGECFDDVAKLSDLLAFKIIIKDLFCIKYTEQVLCIANKNFPVWKGMGH